MPKTVVILGGAFGGLHVAHYLLKNNKDVKVILVSKVGKTFDIFWLYLLSHIFQNSHFYWNLGAVRAIVPGAFPDTNQLFQSLSDALARYPKDRAELVIGAAEALDTNAKTVTVAVAGHDGPPRTLTYDHLVLATGSRNPASTAAADGTVPPTPWKADGTYEDIQALLRSVQDKVKAAKHIVVAGGGATGVEAAAELGFAYGGKPVDKGGKTIVLLAAGPALLGGDKVLAEPARHELTKLHVDVRTDRSVTGVRTLPEGGGRIELTVAGEAAPVVTDLYLPAFGLVPNTDYVPAALLDDRKRVVVDAFYRATGVPSHDVWAVGDVVGQPRPGFIITQKQAAGVAKNLDLVLRGKDPAPVKLLPLDLYVVVTGRSRGVGRANSWRLPSLAVWLAKGRTLGTQYLPSYGNGSIA
ncbi:Pyridine nucleotide-disulfide oxidoreductase, FAD/NAD(P)-binding domain protein [Niveomyces insectorum RCEF 264]|uniref:Pyridine nucleotide-disulfide oxidoreductase, FAD/NAD(P)-binding domain protein n=1 Tax=Niveomyces insectorum RCEF 264 TaxID=1081102 RepID=A0A167QYG3_9HYPO|nr:Pyridine nucleotide-disulfide oxidoreductase, FAD/NAD(P)-binding domain protein [Niveomyces insectorum RCEF 264]